MVHREDRGHVIVLRMDNGKANTLDPESLADLTNALRAIERDEPFGAVVLTGTGHMFSAGVDLYRLLQGGKAYIEPFLPQMAEFFTDLFMYPRPIVAAINGHAIAGGCIIACSCDARVMADGASRIGVPELAVGVPFPMLPLEIMRFATPPHLLQELVFQAKTYTAIEALARGLVEEVVPAAALIDHAAGIAATLARIPSAAFRVTKRALRQPVMDRLARSGSDIDEDVRRFWMSDEAAGAIRGYLAKTIPKTPRV